MRQRLGRGDQPAQQRVLGRAADVWGYAPSYLMSAAIEALALPFIALSRRQRQPADTVEVIAEDGGGDGPDGEPEPAPAKA